MHEIATQTENRGAEVACSSPSANSKTRTPMSRGGTDDSGRKSPAVRRASSAGSFRRENSVDGRGSRSRQAQVNAGRVRQFHIINKKNVAPVTARQCLCYFMEDLVQA